MDQVNPEGTAAEQADHFLRPLPETDMGIPQPQHEQKKRDRRYNNKNTLISKRALIVLSLLHSHSQGDPECSSRAQQTEDQRRALSQRRMPPVFVQIIPHIQIIGIDPVADQRDIIIQFLPREP